MLLTVCGIIGYNGYFEAVPFILRGLGCLDYRGYDSVGIAIHDGNAVEIRKEVGRVSDLGKNLMEKYAHGTLGIGHTRWATCGGVTKANAHPHTGQNGKVVLVHNGCVTNYEILKDSERLKGHTFLSDTDSEVIAHLIETFYEDGIESADAIRSATSMLEGDYALGILFSDQPDIMFAVTNGPSLVLGIGKGENCFSSDILAINPRFCGITYLNNGDLAVIRKDSVLILDRSGSKVEREILKEPRPIVSADLKGYPNHLIKEIYEQPELVQEQIRTLTKRLAGPISDVDISAEIFRRLRDWRFFVIGCGTSFNVSLIAKYYVERFCGIHITAEIASEFQFCETIADKHSIVFVLSQSGETADVLDVVRVLKAHDTPVFAILNIVNSSIGRLADIVIPLNAGPEISVASTKACTLQLATVSTIVVETMKFLDRVGNEDVLRLDTAFDDVGSLMTAALKSEEEIIALARRYRDVESLIFFGRGIDYGICREAALKMMELSYIPTMCFPSGELKHGPLALINDRSVVVAVLTQSVQIDEAINSIREVRSRGSKIILFTSMDPDDLRGIGDDVITFPATEDLLSPLVALMPLQLFAYHMATELGYDVDKPRNLAKSVTVK